MLKSAKLTKGNAYFFNPDTGVVSDYNGNMGSAIGNLKTFVATGDERLDSNNRVVGYKSIVPDAAITQTLSDVVQEQELVNAAGVGQTPGELRAKAPPSDASIKQPENAASLPSLDSTIDAAHDEQAAMNQAAASAPQNAHPEIEQLLDGI